MAGGVEKVLLECARDEPPAQVRRLLREIVLMLISEQDALARQARMHTNRQLTASQTFGFGAVCRCTACSTRPRARRCWRRWRPTRPGRTRTASPAAPPASGVPTRWPAPPRSRPLTGHHILAWARGGPTRLTNLVLLCGYHHTMVHEGQWTLTMHPITGEVRLRRPDGTRHDLTSKTRGPTARR